VTSHPLSEYVRILARGKNASRNMTLDEAKYTMTHFLSGDAEPEQIGAVFMLLRVLEESPEEIAGFAQAINQYWPDGARDYDLIWSSYAGKRRQPMWWVLSALLLREMGYHILVHGTLSHTEGRVYAHEVFKELGLPEVTARDLNASSSPLAYLPCSEIHPTLQSWLGLKKILGVRSPINTVLKTISPHGVPSVQGIFHPNYRNTHTQAALLNDESCVVIKGEGGEFEVNPERTCTAGALLHGEQQDIVIPNKQSHYDDKAASPATSHLIAFWRGELQSGYAREAVLNTAALALCAIRGNKDYTAALELCKKAFDSRDKGLI